MQPSPNPGRISDSLNGVVAISLDDVWAVGVRIARGITQRTLAEHWDGTAWAVVPTPNPGMSSNELQAVAASSSNDVWAVGTQVSGSVLTTLVEHWDGVSWTVSPSPNPSPIQNQFLAVSALSPTDVWAVGSILNADFMTLTEHWDGLSWTVVPSPNPGPYPENFLDAVAQSSPGDAWAVGTNTNNNDSNDLILHWDGTSWTQSPSPTRSFSSLAAVASLAGDNVWAVGGDLDASFHERGRVEHWDGTQWSEVPSPPTGTGRLDGVAFASSSLGWAVGNVSHHQNQTNSVVTELWDGSSWTALPAPNPSVHLNFLIGVTAIPSGSAWAVGSYESHGHDLTLIETITC